jgi:hypothetical protein
MWPCVHPDFYPHRQTPSPWIHLDPIHQARLSLAEVRIQAQLENPRGAKSTDSQAHVRLIVHLSGTW